MTTIWKDVVGYEGLYRISSDGLILSIGRTVVDKLGRIQKVKARLMFIGENRSGYPYARLSKNNIATTVHVHRLLAEAFIENPHRYETVNHKDGNKQNRSLDNLEWASQSLNNQHAYDAGLKKKGEDHYNSRLGEKDVLEIRTTCRKRHPVFGQRALARKHGVTLAMIQKILANKAWRHVSPQ